MPPPTPPLPPPTFRPLPLCRTWSKSAQASLGSMARGYSGQGNPYGAVYMLGSLLSVRLTTKNCCRSLPVAAPQNHADPARPPCVACLVLLHPVLHAADLSKPHWMKPAAAALAPVHVLLSRPCQEACGLPPAWPPPRRCRRVCASPSWSLSTSTCGECGLYEPIMKRLETC